VLLIDVAHHRSGHHRRPREAEPPDRRLRPGHRGLPRRRVLRRGHGILEYLDRFTAALDYAIGGGFLLAADRPEILELAAATFPAGD
jgi:hypothetical protein